MMFAGMIEHELYVPTNALHRDELSGYDYISIPDYTHLTRPGEPALPARYLSFVIPAHARFERVEIMTEQGSFLPGHFTIFPAQQPVPISSGQSEWTSPNDMIYTLDMLYPQNTVQYINEGNLSGYQIVSVLVTPLRFNPHDQTLYLSHYIKFRLYYQDNIVQVPCVSEQQKRLAMERVKALVVNAHQIEYFSPTVNRNLWQSEYIIITDTLFIDAFKPLREWKMRRGVPTEIVTRSWVYANYGGVDNATKIRNFIDAAADSGAVYFLLAGQGDWEHSEEYMPRRDVYCLTSGAGYYQDEDTIPCDLYFADLDGTWDGNSNGTYGETGDGVNMYSDVYVGRAPVKNVTQVNNFVNKVITYEKSPSLSFIEKALLPVGNLWPGNHGNGINDTIAAAIPADWKKAKLYQDYGLISRYTVRDSINQGFHFCHMVGHGNQYGIYYNYGSNLFYNYSDPNSQTNDSTDAVISNSIGCYCGAFEQASASANYDCMAEHMVNDNKRCATATMMNSRYGWGYSNWPNSLGPSGEVSVWFYRKLFGTSAYHLAEVHAASKDQLVPTAGSDPYLRWCLYENNLFGDPEMPIWTDSLKNLTVSFSSDTIAHFGDGTTDTFTVTVQYLGSPIINALVTLMQDSTVYERQSTNASGQARFILADNKFQHQGYVWVTVTKYNSNFLPDLDSGVVIQILNIDESPPRHYLSQHVRVSSNPIQNTLLLSCGSPLMHDATIRMYDIRGSLIKTITLDRGAQTATIPVSELSSGIYFLKTDGIIISQEKIIIVR
jgi:hypothetical protein